jgi:hypothetical protein
MFRAQFVIKLLVSPDSYPRGAPQLAQFTRSPLIVLF